MSYGPPRPSAIRYAGAIVQGRIEACPTVVDANPLALDYKSNLSLDYGTKPSYKVRQPRSSRGVSGDDPEGGAGRGVPRTLASGGPGSRPPGTTTRLRGARSTDPGHAGAGSAAPGEKSPRWSAERRASRVMANCQSLALDATRCGLA